MQTKVKFCTLLKKILDLQKINYPNYKTMKKTLLLSICTFVFIFSGYAQTAPHINNKSASKTEFKAVSKSKKITSNTSKPDKKTLELRKKLAYYQAHTPFQKTNQLSKDERKAEGLPPNKYYESEWELTMSPTLGRPTPENIAAIRKDLATERKNSILAGRVPGDAVDNLWVERGPSNVGGRTRAVMFDPNDPTKETVYAGGVSGGLWKNTAISNANSAWTRVNIPENLAVSCITFDPNNTNVFYVGTGESYVGGDVNGDGVWKSTDGGATFSNVFGGITGPTTFQSAANVTINSPSAVAGSYQCYPTTAFGPAVTTAITANIVMVNDGTLTPTLGCGTTLTNGTALSGKIALIRRGDCTFVEKILNAQGYGAVGVIIMNNIAGQPIPMGGTATNVTVPSAMISKEDGDILEAALAAGTVNGTLNPSAPGAFTGNLVPGIQFINDIKIRNNGGVSEVYVAAGDSFYGAANATTFLGGPQFGLYKSINGGQNWTEIALPLTTTGNKHCPNDIAIAADNKIWVSTTRSTVYGNGGGIVYSSTDGTTFTEKYAVTNGTRTQIAVSSTTPDKVYVLAELSQTGTTDGIEVTIVKTLNGFTSSSATALPASTLNAATRTDTYGFTGQQAFYNLLMEVDPTNDQTVYVGGIDLFKTTNGGTSWNQISTWNGGTSLHSDQHAIAFQPGNSNVAVFGNDGGVYYTGNLATASANSGITSRNKGFNVTQFYSLGVAPTGATGGNLVGDYFAAGAQDNGSQYFSPANTIPNESVKVQSGDGAFCMFDQGADKYYITNYVYNQNINSRSATGTATKGINSEGTTNGDFIAPMILDSNLDILYTDYYTPATATVAAVYQIRRYTNVKIGLTTIVKTALTNALLTSTATAFAVAKTPTTSTTLLVGCRNGKLLKVTSANATTPVWTSITGPSFVGSISDVEYGQTANDIFVTFHNYNVVSIWYSADGGVTWQNKEGNFPDIPVKCILQNPLNTNEVIIGTELGVWYTNTFSDPSPTWNQAYNGMSNVKVTDMDLRNDNTIFAATYGRGIFSGAFTATPLATDNFTDPKAISIYPNPSKGQFTISIPQFSGEVNVMVVDMNGRIVYDVKNETFSNDKSIDLSTLQSGMYLIKISGKEINYTQKIIKN